MVVDTCVLRMPCLTMLLLACGADTQPIGTGRFRLCGKSQTLYGSHMAEEWTTQLLQAEERAGVASTECHADVARGSRVRAHVAMSSVIFGNHQFGVSLTCGSMMVWMAAEAVQGLSAFGDFMLVHA